MPDSNQEVQLTPEEASAHDEMFKAIGNLRKAVTGTLFAVTIDNSLLMMQFDLLMTELFAAGVLSKEKFWKEVAAKIGEMESNVRREVIRQGSLIAQAQGFPRKQ